jgi:hypothetical protein
MTASACPGVLPPLSLEFPVHGLGLDHVRLVSFTAVSRFERRQREGVATRYPRRLAIVARCSIVVLAPFMSFQARGRFVLRVGLI